MTPTMTPTPASRPPEQEWVAEPGGLGVWVSQAVLAWDTIAGRWLIGHYVTDKVGGRERSYWSADAWPEGEATDRVSHWVPLPPDPTPPKAA